MEGADELGASIRGLVAEFGWAAVAVESTPPFTYTAGLWRRWNHPELIITGLPAETAKWVLDRAVQAISAGHPIEADTSIPGLIGAYPAAARRIADEQLPQLAFAADLYRGVIFTALQLVWPDGAGNFPWDRGAAADYRTAQPLLFEPKRRWLPFRR